MTRDMYGEWLMKLIGLIAAAAAVVAVWIGMDRNVIVLPWQDNTVGRQVTDDGLGSIIMRPNRFQQELQRDAWVRPFEIDGKPLGRLLVSGSRFSIEGRGPLRARRIYADTPPAANLLSGRSEVRAERFLHGLQRLMHERGAYVQGISFARSRDGYKANFLISMVQSSWLRPLLDQRAVSNEQRREVLAELVPMAEEGSAGALATHRFETHWVDLDPTLTRYLETWMRNPKKVKPKDTLFVAHVIRHELEHSVSAWDGSYDGEAVGSVHRWLEEGSADTLANWPGEAARTARILGLPYPKAAERASWASFDPGRGGYPEYVETMRTLLLMAGVNTKDPNSFRQAHALLQKGDVHGTPMRLADAIIDNGRAKPKRRRWLVMKIVNLGGDPSRARALERSLR
jgi:hypothetical protein